MKCDERVLLIQYATESRGMVERGAEGIGFSPWSIRLKRFTD